MVVVGDFSSVYYTLMLTLLRLCPNDTRYSTPLVYQDMVGKSSSDKVTPSATRGMAKYVVRIYYKTRSTILSVYSQL
jgi:hypothetical protein